MSLLSKCSFVILLYRLRLFASANVDVFVVSVTQHPFTAVASTTPGNRFGKCDSDPLNSGLAVAGMGLPECQEWPSQSY